MSQCIICFEDDREMVDFGPCKHKACRGCVRTVATTSGVCPVCQGDPSTTVFDSSCKSTPAFDQAVIIKITTAMVQATSTIVDSFMSSSQLELQERLICALIMMTQKFSTSLTQGYREFKIGSKSGETILCRMFLALAVVGFYAADIPVASLMDNARSTDPRHQVFITNDAKAFEKSRAKVRVISRSELL